MEITSTKYKQTEVGLIPEDWESSKVGNLTEFINGIAHEKIINPLGNYVVVNSKFVSSEGNVEKNCMELFNPAKKNDILMVMSDVPNGKAIAKCFLVDSDRKYSVNQRICILRSKESDPQFLFFQINRNKFYLKFDDGVKQTNLRREDVLNCPIPIPPTLNEQKAIATALGDVDSLISSLDKLITKKKAIKQGAMQELLTPKDNWRKVSLIELADGKKSNFDDGDWIESEYIADKGIRLIQTGNIGVGNFIDKTNKKYISEDSFSKLKCKEVLEGDLLICRLAEPAGRACVMPNIGESKVITSVDVSIFRGASNLSNRLFLSQYFTTQDWFNEVIERVGGTTHKRISRGSLGRIGFLIPSLKEQESIAKILLDMDLEIQSLENKKAKYQEIKQGMMQELLTGKTRLV